MPLDEAAAPGGEAAQLAVITAALDVLAPADVDGVLQTVRDGVRAAARCGLAAARDPRWRARRRNAEAVEHALAEHLARTRAIHEAALPGPGEVDEALTGSGADAAVAAISAFSRTAERVLRVAAGQAEDWTDRTVCWTCTRLVRELAECWDGQHPTYAHRLG
ncbi:hypothetical protein [Amycolatopsis anabasis]|uniref:hypothetical protein n=1 Tax=Amycolatopsis anabasis TaxID=1840409 RepID=UPI00131CB6BB|nr:hypothetical protein [Amycolatopsis anabasis]